MSKWDVIVIGAGAAGLLCAIEAGKHGRRVLVPEHADRVGKKIAISGGGRCNFTNIYTNPDNSTSSNPHFCKSALACYTPANFVALVEKHGIAYHERVTFFRADSLYTLNSNGRQRTSTESSPR